MALTSDEWAGGKLVLTQPAAGHRVGSDAALLAAALDLRSGRAVDVGAGVGAVGLTIAVRAPDVRVDLVERDAALAALAAENAARNGVADRVRSLAVDVMDRASRHEAGLSGGAEAVLTNPPYFAAGAVRVSPDVAKARAHVFPTSDGEKPPLCAWIRTSLALLAPDGRFAMIHRPEALGAILEAVGARLGGLTLLPVYPRAAASARRILVAGVKGSRAPLRIAPGLILHELDGRLTRCAEAIHRGDALVDWGG